MPVTALRQSVAAQHAPASAAQAIEARRSQSLVSICQAEIERMIFAAELGLGARVNEVALANRLGVSRGPVREACRSLLQAGLLEARANRGFFVRRLTHKEVIDLYDLRAGLMRLAGELAARNVTGEQLARLRSMVEAMDAAAEAGAADRFQLLNGEFHRLLVIAADNRKLAEVYRGLANETRLFPRRGLASKQALQASNREHRAIVEAVASHDAARAAATLENHMIQGKARFLDAAVNELED